MRSWDEFEFLPGALAGLSRLAAATAPVIVITNQRGIALGRMTSDDLADIHERMTAAVVSAGGRLDAIYHCPHDGGCTCRKPAVGMFTAAAADFGLDLAETAVVGDQPNDMIAGRRIGALRVLVGADTITSDLADLFARDLEEAVEVLIARRYLLHR